MANINNKRYTSFAAIAYLEDVTIDDIVEVCLKTHFPCYVSPLHRPSGFDEHGSKPHWHILCVTPTTKSLEQITFAFSDLHTTKWFPVDSKIGYARYLLHLDNPEKEQFSTRGSLLEINCDDYDTLIQSARSKKEVLTECRQIIIAYIFNAHVPNYKSLCLWALNQYNNCPTIQNQIIFNDVLSRPQCYKELVKFEK